MIVNLEDFEFAALQKADNYRAALLAEFEPFLVGHVLEVGAGIGQLSETLSQKKEITHFTSVEPDARFANRLRSKFPQLELIQGTIDDVPAAWTIDAILSVNVLEHIEADARELSSYCQRLAERRGVLCLFVPARPEIFAPIDRDFGHFRRYTRTELGNKLSASGFVVRRLVYFNLLGYFAWWWNFHLLKKRSFAAKQVHFFDRCIFPLQHRFEARILRPPIGMSLLAVAAAL
ncbi:MAG: class I SAM-dependent methyltransferase [Candidatus Aminicenantes bacterium]|nr:class I SAM-dependent methyltransferase [Candidatus Aminicenantes bacterium]